MKFAPPPTVSAGTRICSKVSTSMKTKSLPSLYRYCMSRLSTVAVSTLMPALKVRSRDLPERTFFNLVRTNAGPFPGLTCWNSTTVQSWPSRLSTMPFFRSFVVATDSVLRSWLVCAEATLPHGWQHPGDRFHDTVDLEVAHRHHVVGGPTVDGVPLPQHPGPELSWVDQPARLGRVHPRPREGVGQVGVEVDDRDARQRGRGRAVVERGGADGDHADPRLAHQVAEHLGLPRREGHGAIRQHDVGDVTEPRHHLGVEVAESRAEPGGERRADGGLPRTRRTDAVSYTHLRAHETRHDLVCRLLLEK